MAQAQQEEPIELVAVAAKSAQQGTSKMTVEPPTSGSDAQGLAENGKASELGYRARLAGPSVVHTARLSRRLASSYSVVEHLAGDGKTREGVEALVAVSGPKPLAGSTGGPSSTPNSSAVGLGGAKSAGEDRQSTGCDGDDGRRSPCGRPLWTACAFWFCERRHHQSVVVHQPMDFGEEDLETSWWEAFTFGYHFFRSTILLPARNEGRRRGITLTGNVILPKRDDTEHPRSTSSGPAAEGEPVEWYGNVGTELDTDRQRPYKERVIAVAMKVLPKNHERILRIFDNGWGSKVTHYYVQHGSAGRYFIPRTWDENILKDELLKNAGSNVASLLATDGVDWDMIEALGNILELDPMIFVHFSIMVEVACHRNWYDGESTPGILEFARAYDPKDLCWTFVNRRACSCTSDESIKNVTSFYGGSDHIAVVLIWYSHMCTDIDQAPSPAFDKRTLDIFPYGLSLVSSGLARLPCPLTEPTGFRWSSYRFHYNLTILLSQPEYWQLLPSPDHGAVGDPGARADTFLFVLALRLWKENLALFMLEVDELEQSDTMAPANDIFAKLHTSRLKLAYLRSELEDLEDIEPRVQEILKNRNLLKLVQSQHEGLDRKATRMAERHNNLFQTIMGTINLKDARESVRQAEISTILTVVAVIYLPLSLVTGIFGMNIKEINGGVPTWRGCAIAAGVAMGVTLLLLAVFVGVRYCIRRQNPKSKGGEHMV